jgi:hypothetical protein
VGESFSFRRIREFLLLFGHLSHSFFYLFRHFCAALFCSGDLLLLDTLQMASAPQPLAAEADLPSPVDDYTPTFYVGHHESKRPLPVTDFVLRQAQDVGVSASPQPCCHL